MEITQDVACYHREFAFPDLDTVGSMFIHSLGIVFSYRIHTIHIVLATLSLGSHHCYYQHNIPMDLHMDGCYIRPTDEELHILFRIFSLVLLVIDNNRSIYRTSKINIQT